MDERARRISTWQPKEAGGVRSLGDLSLQDGARPLRPVVSSRWVALLFKTTLDRREADAPTLVCFFGKL